MFQDLMKLSAYKKLTVAFVLFLLKRACFWMFVVPHTFLESCNVTVATVMIVMILATDQRRRT